MQADNDVIVRDDRLLPTREFLDTRTSVAKVVCLFYSPATGDATTLELQVTVQGTDIKTLAKQTFYGFVDSENRSLSLTYFVSILVICAVIVLLNMRVWLESRSLCLRYDILLCHKVNRTWLAANC